MIPYWRKRLRAYERGEKIEWNKRYTITSPRKASHHHNNPASRVEGAIGCPEREKMSPLYTPVYNSPPYRVFENLFTNAK